MKYPDIQKRAEAEGAQIFWGDETGINNQEYYIRGFSPKGVTPVVPYHTKVQKINMISAISMKGICNFMCYEENMTQQLFIEFMQQLVYLSDRKVFFIVDNLKVHHGKIVQEWLKNHKDEIEVFYTPPYSPEINPDEYLNHCLKKCVHSGILPRTSSDILNKVLDFMSNLQKIPEKVISLFCHKNLDYIRQCAI